jgi:hypothetical protein
VRLQFTVGLNVSRFRRGVVIIVAAVRVFTFCNVFRSEISEKLTAAIFRVTE